MTPGTPPMQQLAVFSEELANLIPAIGCGEFPALLIGMIKRLVPVSDATIVVYPGTDLPVIDYFEVPESSGRSALDIFVKGAFLLDPYYLAATRDQKFGLFGIRELSPAGFKDSEYYRTWYRDSNYEDECGYLIPITGEGFVNISLGRTGSHSIFTPDQITVLESIRPTVEVVCQAHWATCHSATSPCSRSHRGSSRPARCGTRRSI